MRQALLIAIVLGFAALWPSSGQADSATYQYDSNGRIQTITYANGTTIVYSYDTNGNRISVVTTCPGKQC